MYFASSPFLYALGLLAIPILIHLFSFYVSKTVLFTNVKLLRNIQEQQKRVSQIKSWILLLLRCLALAAIVLAFAEPTLPRGASNTEGSLLGIYLDNSPSMVTGSVGNSNFYSAKAQAKNWVNQFPADKQFLFANNLQKPQRTLSKTEALQAINETQPSKNEGGWDGVLSMQRKGKSVDPIVVLSDFQKNNFNQNLPLPDSAALLLTQLTGQNTGNISIDSVAMGAPFLRKGQSTELRVWLTNYSDQSYEDFPINLELNGVQKAPVSVALPANGTAEASFPILVKQSGWVKGLVSIVDNPIGFDNTLYFAFKVTEQVPVIQIGTRPNGAVKKLFAQDPDFDFTYMPVSQFDFAALQTAGSTVILSDLPNIGSGLRNALVNFTQRGGNLVVVLNEGINPKDYAALLQAMNAPYPGKLYEEGAEISFVADQAPFFKPVFAEKPAKLTAPTTNYSWRLQNTSEANTLLGFNEEQAFLSQRNVANGQVFVFASGFDAAQNRFTQNGLFAPTLLRITEYSGQNNTLYYTLGTSQRVSIPIDEKTDLGTLRLEKEGVRLLPTCQRQGSSALCYLQNLPLEDGWYTIQSNENALGFLSVNSSRVESDMTFLNPKEIETLLPKDQYNYRFISNIGNNTNERQAGISDIALWPYCIGLALLFLTLEMIWLQWKVQKTS